MGVIDDVECSEEDTWTSVEHVKSYGIERTSTHPLDPVLMPTAATDIIVSDQKTKTLEMLGIIPASMIR